MCDRAESWAHGTAVFASVAPSYWDYNVVRVEGPDPGLDAIALMEVADALQAPLAHRKIEVEDEAAGTRVRPAFEAAGWQVERLAWMRREGSPPGAPEGVEEMSFAATEPLRVEWASGDNRWPSDAEAVLRFAELEAIEAERRRPRAFAVRAGAELAGFSALWAPPGTDAAEVEQVYVSPAHRGRGIGEALVAAALAAAGRSAAWIVADDAGRAKNLYARLGFTTVWLQHGFTRRP